MRIRAISMEHIAEEKYDVITLLHSLKHMPDTLSALTAVQSLFAPGGVCVIDVPTVESEAWERYGVDWFDLDAPRHLFLHTERSMKIAAEKAGLKLINVKHINVPQSFYVSEMYRRDIPLYDDSIGEIRSAASVFTPDEIAEFEAQKRGAWARFLMGSAS